MISRQLFHRPVLARQALLRPLRSQRRFESAKTATTETAAAAASSASSSAPVAVGSSVSNGSKHAAGASQLSVWHRLGPITTVFQAYGRAARKRPYVVQTIFITFIFGTADVIAQYIGGKEEYDYWRTARSMLIGGACAIPQYKWFVFLSRNFNYPSLARSLATKVAVSQSCFVPVFNVYFFGSQSLLSGNDLSTTKDLLVETVPRSMLNSLKLWPAVTCFAFVYIPLEHRSIFTGVIALGWQTYLNFLNKQVEMKILAAQSA